MTDARLRAAMQDTNRVFEQEVVARRDFGALDRVYTADARILPPGAAMITGREAIRAFWRDTVMRLDVRAVRLITLDVVEAGDMAVEVARGEIETAGAERPIEIKYVVTWKQEGGAWRWHVDIWNMSQ